MAKANLLVSYDPAHEGSAKSEIEALLKEIKADGIFLKSEVDGLFELVLEHPKAAVKELKNLCGEESGMFKYTFHWIPIDTWCKTSVEDMQKTIKKHETDIKENERWKMEFEKRLSHEMHTYDMISKLTEVVENPHVDLEKPQKIIKVEVIGKHTGISVLKPEEQLIVPREKK
jgi:tRNA acetyltransferase TAN1